MSNMCTMTMWTFVLAVMVTIVKTGDAANEINEAKNNERVIRIDGNYRELADEIRVLRDIVRGQGGKQGTMEEEVERLKSEVSEQKRRNNIMKTIVKRQERSLVAQNTLIDRLIRQNAVFETFISKINNNDCKQTTNKTVTVSGCGHPSSEQPRKKLHRTGDMLAKLSVPVRDKRSLWGYFDNVIDKTDRIPSKMAGEKVPANKRLVLGSDQGIAFTAYLDHQISHMARGQTVKCNNTLLDEGGAYNIHTGVFTVPKSGVYFFYFAVHAYTNNTLVLVDLTVDDRVMVDAIVDTISHTVLHDRSASNAAILRLSQGQSVWLTAYPSKGYNGVLNSDNSLRVVTFSGVLLYE